MNILLIGSGAREHAIARALKANKAIKLYNIGSHINPGIAELAQEIAIISFADKTKICAFAKEKAIDFAIIGPEKPLELGLADALWQAEIPVVGPTQALAQIETSKGFARDLMQKYKVAGLPRYQRFSHYNEDAKAFIDSLQGQYVVKADGLMAGKGVKIAGEHLHSLEEACSFCEEINGPFVIEEKLVGPEFSLLSFSDGTSLVHMPVVQDYKRLLEGNKGPNTGGMGTYTLSNHLLSFLTKEEVLAAQAINQEVIAALREETGEVYRGILYGGYMNTANGIKVIEFNARFGDPESINLLGLLETDFVEVCAAILTGELSKIEVEFKKQASVCKYLVPPGYPDEAEKGGILDCSQVQNSDALYYASVAEQQGTLIMLGSRALAVLCLDEEPHKAGHAVEEIIAKIKGHFYHRADIGHDV